MDAEGPAVLDRRPMAMEAVRVALLLSVASLAVLGGSALTTTPVQAAVNLAAVIVGLTAAITAYRAIGRDKRWGAWYAVAVLLAWVSLGVWQVVNPRQPGQLVIPLGAIIAGTILLWLRSIWSAVTASLPDRTPVGPAATVLLLASILVPFIAPMTELSDPTLVSPEDLAIRLEVACESPPIGSTTQGVTATATFTWARQDLLPSGIAGLVREPRPRGAMLVAAVWAVERPTGNEADGWALDVPPPSEPWLLAGGSWGPPSDAAITLGGGPPGQWTAQAFLNAASWQFPASLVPERMAVDQPYRATWHFTQRGPITWPAVRLRYVHEYRFALEATAGCGETVDAVAAS